MARRGKRLDEIREILLRDHEATLGRFTVSHRDDAGFKAGTAQRAEAERERRDARSEYEADGGDGAHIDWMFTLGDNAIAGGAAIAGAGMLDAVMDLGVNENPTDAAIALAVNAITLGGGAGASTVIKSRAKALRGAFVKGISELAKRNPGQATLLDRELKKLSKKATKIWNSGAAASANATAQTFAAEFGQGVIRGAIDQRPSRP